MPRKMLYEEQWFKLLIIMQEFKIYEKKFFWNRIFKRFNGWSEKSKLMSIFKRLAKDLDYDWKMIDGSIVKSHQHSCGAKKSSDTSIGKSVAGNTSKIHMVTDSHGNPVHFEITGGNVHIIQMASELIERTPKSTYTIADKGYDGEYLRWLTRECDSIPMIPKKNNSKVGNDDIDKIIYKQRHYVENNFAKLKHNRAIATRYDKLKRNYVGIVSLACAMNWLML